MYGSQKPRALGLPRSRSIANAKSRRRMLRSQARSSRAADSSRHERKIPMKLKGLGRGLDALLDKDNESGSIPEEPATLRIEQLQRGRYQPRTKMDENSLQELAGSIRKQGLMHTRTVRPVGG